MNDSPFRVMLVVGTGVQITTCMSRLPVYFRGRLRSPLHNQDLQERKSIISFNFRYEFYGRFKAVKVVKKLL
jgi:hypothetical protein